MNRATRFVLGILVLTALAATAWWWTSHRDTAANEHQGKPSASKIAHPITEIELGRVTLSPQAEERLGLTTATVEQKSVQPMRVYGGDVLVPVGRTIMVAAPLAGILRAPETGAPVAGRQVTKGECLFYLIPILSQDARTTLSAAREDATGQVNNARTQLEMSQLALARAERLFKADAGSKRAVEEATAQHDTALRLLEATQSRLGILTKALEDANASRAEPIPITAPESGVLRNVTALSDQHLPLGATIFEVIDLTEVWIRVPVYVGDLSTIDRSNVVQIGNLNLHAGDPTWPAVPVEAPPSADPVAATVDLYFQLDNAEPNLTPGQRVGVSIPLLGNEEHLTVPWGAVVYDVQGGSWIYQRVGPRTYERQRVLVRFVKDDLAVLATGPIVGSEVVIEGAQELFGAETGFSK